MRSSANFFFSLFQSSLTLYRPYIGSCRNRDYISNRSLLLSNQSYITHPRVFNKSLFSKKNHREEHISSFHSFDQRTNDSSLTPIRTPSMSFLPYDQRICDQGNKYIIQLKTDEYHENEFLLTPIYDQYQLIIDAKHNEEDHLGGFIRRELHKIFLIPNYIDLRKYTHSYNRHTQELTIEMPYLSDENKSNVIINSPLTFSYTNLNLTEGETIVPPSIPKPIEKESQPFDFELFRQSAFHPQIISSDSTGEKLLMSLDMSDYQPEDIQISIKDQSIIVKAERKSETDIRKSRQTFFQSTTLPPRTDIERLQSNYLEGKLLIEAPYIILSNTSNE